MSTPPVDLDIPASWPSGLSDLLAAHMDDLVREREARRAYSLSGGRWLNPAPSAPVTQACLARIEAAMKDRTIRVFHATRLIDFEEVRTLGLKPLQLNEQINRLERVLAPDDPVLAGRSLRDLIATVDRSSDYFAIREGQVWFTPLRRNLHEVGCDVFFEHWGGEALERLLAHAAPGLESLVKAHGEPAVVVANIPAFGCCLLGDTSVASTMLDLALERSSKIEIHPSGWDVLLRQPVPPEWIERVVGADDDFVAG